MNKVFALAAVTLVSACSTVFEAPRTAGERSSGYGYVPLDPIPVREPMKCSPGLAPEKLPIAFPDNTVRIAYKTIAANGDVSFGPITSTQNGESYQIIIDFITSDVVGFPIYFKPYRSTDGRTFEEADILDFSLTQDGDGARTAFLVATEEDALKRADLTELETVGRITRIPLYVGVGLRLTADLQAVKGSTELTGLGAITAAVENGFVSGSMVVQTLGINGKGITSALPIQSDLNATTIQNAIVSIGSIKALMYEDGVNLRPRIVGFHDPIGGGQPFVNALVPLIAESAPDWSPRCLPIESKTETEN